MVRSITGALLVMLLAAACVTGIDSEPEVGSRDAFLPGSRVSLVSSSVSQNPLPAGELQTATATLRSETRMDDMIVDIRIYNSSGQVVSKQTFEPVDLAASVPVELRFDYQSPSSLPVGEYLVSVGVWDASWNTYLYETKTSFIVGEAAPPDAPSCAYPAWVEYQHYPAGSIVTYDGNLYKATYENPGYIPTVSTYYWALYMGCGSPPPPPTSSANLPTKVVGGYFTTWDFRNGVTLRSVVDTTSYNLIYIAFAIGTSSSSGTLRLDLPAGVSSPADFKSQVAYANSKGKQIIVSVGGYFDLPNSTHGYRLDSSTKVDQFMDSMRELRTTWGFNGMDWDLEHGERPDAAGIITASQRMRSEFGSSFIIAAAPGVNLSSWVGSGGILDSLGSSGWDLVGEQVYDWGVSESVYRSMIIDRMTVLSTKYGASKVVLGNKYKTDEGGVSTLADPSNVSVDISTTKSALTSLRSAGVNIRGAFVWTVQSDADAGYLWQAANGVGGEILSHP